MVNSSSKQVHCTARSETKSIVCVSEGSDDDAAGRLGAYLAHLIHAHTAGALEGWAVVVTRER